MKILLIEPSFPYPAKSKLGVNETHKNFVPIGLLKLGSYYKSKKNKVTLVRGKKSADEIEYVPDKILITSLFTYWSEIFWDTVEYYRSIYPRAKIEIGGIYVTLHCTTEEFKINSRKHRTQIHVGVHKTAEQHLPDYSLLSGDIDYHATHAMRGCIRRCKFCGTWRLEPEMVFKTAKQITKELVKVGKNKIIFYDNNFLANPNIEEILEELAQLKINKRPVLYESQSGFDGRLLEKNKKLAKLIKAARFQNVRIAWDNGVSDKKSIKKQIDYLVKAGYAARDLSVFMIYNFNHSLDDMIAKQKSCLKWGVQITDCRYRPLTATYDNYDSSAWRKGQTSKDYYIHEEGGWSDDKIRLFRNLVRTHNITIRYAKDKNNKFKELFRVYVNLQDPKKCLSFMKNEMGYSKRYEKWSAINNTYKYFGAEKAPSMDEIEANEILQERIRVMNRFKNIYKKDKAISRDTLKDIYRQIVALTKEKANNKVKGDFALEFIDNQLVVLQKGQVGLGLCS